MDMKTTKWSTIALGAVLLFSAGLQSCVKTAPEEVLDYNDFYKTTDDADAAILGLYGEFMTLAGQVVVLNELRADLLDVTSNASSDLEEVNMNRNSASNVWTDVTSFYKVIGSCNDMLDNFDKMLADKIMTEDEYEERYSDVAALRCWLYYQLGLHFREVQYITQPVVVPDDVQGPKLSLTQLVKELINCMESLPTLENYSGSKLIQNTLDGYSLKPIFIDKRCFLGDLYLMDNRFLDAATIYRDVLTTDEDKVETATQYTYRLYTWVYPGTSGAWQIRNQRGRYNDRDAMQNDWVNMFQGTTSDKYRLGELIWFCSYDKKFQPTYPFFELFNPVGVNGGEYLLKPSDYAVEDIWGTEQQTSGVTFDARGLTGAFEEMGDEYYVTKYSQYDEESTGTVGDWFLYRAGMLHLRYAEAANRCGFPYLAWVMVNDGLSNNFVYTHADGTAYTDDSIKVTGWGDIMHPYPYPFSFDARYSKAPLPVFTMPWRGSGGVRGRANLPNKDFPDDCLTTADSIRFVEKLIVAEAARELGFEGHRWEDLVRVSHRMNNDPGYLDCHTYAPQDALYSAGDGDKFFWEENLKKKYDRAGIGGVDLSTEASWFLEMY